jgi:D-glycero-alpha-D-manno-heptose-7-phosphate kinase
VRGGLKMLIRSIAPLRLGLAGGGTDVSPYSDLYGGAVLNATISMYAYATIEPRNDGKIEIVSIDRKESLLTDAKPYLEIDGKLDLIKGVYNRIVKDFNKGKPLAFTIYTYADAPAGSGLGTSSTVVVTVIGAFTELLGLPLGEYDIAHLAFEIERLDLNQAGGKQDQYAAAFGGFNFMEFYDNHKVIVNPLRIKQEIIYELQHNLILYYTGTSRLSSKIIEAQVISVKSGKKESVEAMHKLKEQAILMKEAILKGKVDEVGEILHFGWQHKKEMAEGITNPVIDDIYETALKSGATGGKISGAGGGGFIIFYCPNNTKYKVIEELKKFGGEFRRYQFTKYGLNTWRL